MRSYTSWVPVFVVVLSLAASATGAEINFVPLYGGNWSVAGNWDLGRVPQSYDDVNIVANGSISKIVTYDDSDAYSFSDVLIDGTGTGYGLILHDAYLLKTENMKIGMDGEGYHWMEDYSYLWVTENLFVGRSGNGEGHFYLDVSGTGSGVEVDGLMYVGYQAEGDFDHHSGPVEAGHVFVGQNAPGTYWLKGGETTSTLDIDYYMVVGNGDTGLFEQTGGAVDIASNLHLGLNVGGSGTYLMKGGTLDVPGVYIGWHGDGMMTQSGGEVTIGSSVNIGYEGANPHRAWYKINTNDGSSTLDVGGNINVGEQGLAKYEQSGGTVTVENNLEIFDHDTSDSDYSYVYLGSSAGTLGVHGEIINHAGYYDQDGGVVTTPAFTNDSAHGINLDNSADLRTRSLINNAGTVLMTRNAKLRGPLAIPPSLFWLCNFENSGTFTMGTATADGGEFSGTLTNYGTFNYYNGDFSGSSLLNYGTFNNEGDFECDYMENYNSIRVHAGQPITVNALAHDPAIENNGNFSMYSGARLTLGNDRPLVNNDNLYAGGTIADATTIVGDVVNNDYMVPSGNTAKGVLFIQGDYTANSTSTTRIRIGGLYAGTDHDQLRIVGHADLDGELDVRLTDSFTPSIGDYFVIMSYLGLTGEFSSVRLPILPRGRYWRVHYYGTVMELVVVDHPVLPGDCNDDGDIDLLDYEDFPSCVTGPDGTADPDCDCLDIDDDGDVDLADYSEFQLLFEQ